MNGPAGEDRILSRLGRPEAFLVVLLTWVAIYLPALGVSEIQGEEGRRILPAVTMLKTGDWLVPHLAGVPYSGKPPFINWVIAASFRVTGRHDEVAARLPSALFVLAFTALMIWFPGEWPGRRARLIAALLFLTTYGIIKKGRESEIEGVYISLTSMATFLWLGLWTRGSSKWLLWLAPCPLLVCGMLTKGPPILLFFYAPVLGILAYTQRLRTFLSLPSLATLLLSLGIPAVWAHLAFPPAPGSGAIANLAATREIVTRLISTDIDWGQWSRHVVRTFTNLLPWVLYAPLLWRRDFTSHLPPTQMPLFRGARLGMALSLVGITVIPGNGGTYALPALGLASLLLGWVLGAVGELPDQGRLWRRLLLTGYLLTGPVTVAAIIILRHYSLWTFVLLAATVSGTIVLVRWRMLFRTPVPLTILSAVFAAVVTILSYRFALPLMAQAEERRPVAALVNAKLPADEPLYVYGTGFQDFCFYLRAPLEYLTDPNQIDERVRLLLVHERAYQELRKNPVVAPQIGRTLCDFTRGLEGNFRLLELTKAAGGKRKLLSQN